MNNINISGIGILNPAFNKYSSIIDTKSFPYVNNQIIDNDILPSGMSGKDLRHMSKLTKMSLYAAKNAFKNSQSNNTGIFFGSTHGSISMLKKFNDYILNFGPDLTSPICFSNGIPNAPLATISTFLNIHNGGTTLLSDDNTGLELLKLAYLSITNNDYEKCLIGASEEVSEQILIMYKNKIKPNVLPIKTDINSYEKIMLPIIESSVFFLVEKNFSKNSFCTYRPLENLKDINSIDLIISNANSTGNNIRKLTKLKKSIVNNHKKIPLILSKHFFGQTFSVSSLFSIIIGISILKDKKNFYSHPINEELNDFYINTYNPNDISKILIHSINKKGLNNYCILEKNLD